jgi:hypothetical protein
VAALACSGPSLAYRLAAFQGEDRIMGRFSDAVTAITGAIRRLPLVVKVGLALVILAGIIVGALALVHAFGANTCPWWPPDCPEQATRPGSGSGSGSDSGSGSTQPPPPR